MRHINRFFWFCSGVHQDTLSKYPAEHSKYVGIGATIFFTGLFAALSGGYALYFVFSGAPNAILYALFFGLLWGLAIFNMDRYIVSSINKNASAGKQFLQATPRILLAILIGVVISRPLELRIFDKEIRDQLRITYLDRQRAGIDTLNKAFDSKYHIEISRLDELKSERDSLQKSILDERQKLNMEIFGEKSVETSGIVGYGTHARRRQAALDKQEQYLDSLRAYIAAQEVFVLQRKQFDGLMDNKLMAGAQLDSAVNLAGFADRNAALNDLKYREDGSVHEANYYAITFIMLLFIFFECLPVLVKLMSARGAYDMDIHDREAVHIHRSGKNREAGIVALDEVQEDKIEALKVNEKRPFYEDELL